MQFPVNGVENLAAETETCRVDWIEVFEDQEEYLGREDDERNFGVGSCCLLDFAKVTLGLTRMYI